MRAGPENTENPRALVVQHHPHGDAGRLERALRASGLGVDVVRTDLGELPPTLLAGYAAYVSMGGEMFISDAARYPFIEIEQRLFRDAIAAGIPAIGICLGAQILASALGAEVSRRWPAQIGWDVVGVEVDLDDPIVGSLAPESVLFEWHHQSFDLPPGAIHLAGSDAVRVQAFRSGSAWGFQFHLEIEARHVEAWSGSVHGGDELSRFGMSRSSLLSELTDHLPGQMAKADRVFGRFAELATVDRGTGPLFAPT